MRYLCQVVNNFVKKVGGGGGARVDRRPPLKNKKKVFWLYWSVLFLLLFLHMGAFLLRFSHFWGPFHHVGAFSLLFTSWWGSFLGLPPPPLQKFLLALMIARRFREHSPENFFCVTAI